MTYMGDLRHVAVMDLKRCPDCDNHIPIDRFGRNRSATDGLATYCREHHNARMARWSAGNKAKVKAAKRKSDLLRHYGLELSDVDRLLEAQDHNCPVCEQPLGDKWHIDHDHVSGAVRGILHGPCNTMLGHAADDPNRLRQGADYLERVR